MAKGKGDSLESRVKSFPLPPAGVEHFHWELGDGSEADGEMVRHVCAAAGRYQVTLTARDDLSGACGTGTDSVAVRINTRPVAAN